MTPQERQRQIDEIFDEACRQPSEEQNRYLDQACKDLPTDVRVEVEQLLRSHKEVVTGKARFLDRMPVNIADVLRPPPDRKGQDVERQPEIPAEVPHDVSNCPELSAIDAGVDLPEMHEHVGGTIGPYKLLQQIGEGGFGVVYMAQQTEPIKRRVALKIIKLGMDTKQVVGRFEAERQALALMDHPNIAKVLDAGATESGRPYFVMELVRGVPITEFCDENKLTTRERLELFVPVCQAIQHAHQKAVIHRDIKPTNVLVTMHDDKAVPKVIDFGIAKATQAELTAKTVFTQFEQFIGTPAYMSPEQAQMSGLDIDTRCDVYALGVLLYELLTGCTPFDPAELIKGGYEEIRRRIREEEPPRPSNRVSTMDDASRTSLARARQMDPDNFRRLLRGDLDWIIMKALEKDRTRRYESASGLAQDVERFLRDEPVSAVAPSNFYRLKKFTRRNRTAVITSAAFAIILISGTAVASWQAYVATVQRNRARTAEQRWETEAGQRRREAERANQARDQHRREAYAADMKAAQVALESNNLGQSAALLNRYLPRPGEEDLRGIEWRYLWQAHQSDEIHSWPHPNMTPSVRFSPDGRYIVSACFDKNLRVWDVASRKLITTIFRGVEDQLFRQSFCFAPNGQALASEHEDGVVLIDSATWQIVKTLELPADAIAWEDVDEPPEPVHSLMYSPDGEFLVATVQAGIAVWDTSHWQASFWETTVPTSNVTPRGFANPTRMAFIDDKRLAACSSGGVRLYDLDSKTHSDFSKGLSVATYVPRNWLVYGDYDGVIELFDMATGETLWRHQAHDSLVAALAFSSDGQLLATGGSDQQIHLWRTDTKERLLTLRGHLNEVWSLQFAPSGGTLVSSGKDGTVKLWHTQPTPDPNRWWLDETMKTQGFDLKGQHVIAIDDQRQRVVTITGHRDAFHHWSKDRLHKSVRIDPPLFGLRSSKVSLKDSTYYSIHKGIVHRYDFETEMPVQTLEFAESMVSLPTVSPDGRWAAGFVRADKNELCIWNLDTRECVARLADFDPLTRNLGRNRGNGVGFSDDGQLMAYSDANYVVKVWDLGRGQLRWSLPGHVRHTLSFDFSPDSKLLASGSWDGQIRIWNVETGKLSVPPLHGHGTRANAWFSPDGMSLVSEGGYTVRIWHVSTGREMVVLRGMRGATYPSASFLSPTGRLWVLRELDGSIRVERIPSFEEIGFN